ncbi:MAG: hypothetical protein ACK2UI_06150 [Anaerolineae bacterium]|jgi:hypothetical protein
MRIWLRRDSLQNHFDLDALVKEIESAVPANVDFSQSGANDHRIDFNSSAEDGRIVG